MPLATVSPLGFGWDRTAQHRQKKIVANTLRPSCSSNHKVDILLA